MEYLFNDTGVLLPLMLHLFNTVKLCYLACLKDLIGLIKAECTVAMQEKGLVAMAGKENKQEKEREKKIKE